MPSTWPSARSRSCSGLSPPRASSTGLPWQAADHQVTAFGWQSTTEALRARSSSHASARTVSITDSFCRAWSTERVNW